jgi:uncharacterized protein (DUF952 family)
MLGFPPFAIREQMRMIYRIAEAADWAAARQNGMFASTDLSSEGFIHCSEHNQVLRTAEKYFSGRQGLILLQIDEQALGPALKREDLGGTGEAFPHVYAAIPLAAIRAHASFSAGADGRFTLPA